MFQNSLMKTILAVSELQPRHFLRILNIFHCIITHQAHHPKKQGKTNFRIIRCFRSLFALAPLHLSENIYNSMLANYVVCDNNHKFSDDLCYLCLSEQIWRRVAKNACSHKYIFPLDSRLMIVSDCRSTNE